MQEILEILQDTAIDSIKLIPFLFVTYLIMEYIEHKTSQKVKEKIKKSGKYGPILGGIVGIFPQCGFSVSATNLYAARVITLGTLMSVYLATSDEMLPILISEAMPISTILTILGIIFLTISWFILYKFIIKINNKQTDILYNLLIAGISYIIKTFFIVSPNLHVNYINKQTKKLVYFTLVMKTQKQAYFLLFSLKSSISSVS